jgi:hypothetical protein
VRVGRLGFPTVALLGVSAALALIFLAPRAPSQDQNQPPALQDPPGRAARLDYTQGAVSFEPAGVDDWTTAAVNRPLTTGDKLWSDNASRAELDTGTAAIRLGDSTGVALLNLNDRVSQVQLTTGSLNVKLRDLSQDETFEVDTPNLAISLVRPGQYRVDVNEAGDATVVTVRDGETEAAGGSDQQDFDVPGPQRAMFQGTDHIKEDTGAPGFDDEFDAFCAQRDQALASSPSAQYVPPGTPGYQDLDNAGSWRPVPEYGNAWFPSNVPPDWAPYRYGTWAFVEPWGWTWVDDAPWGYAPFHYGRWAYVGGAWGWVPGPQPVIGVAYGRPVYAPALVAFIGGAGPGVAWVPLGPRDPFIPTYRVSEIYVTRVNVTNASINEAIVRGAYRSGAPVAYTYRQPFAATMVSRDTFGGGGRVNRGMLRVDARALASAQYSRQGPGVARTREAVMGGRVAGAQVRRPPAAFVNRPVVARSAPPPQARASVRSVQPPARPAGAAVRPQTQPGFNPPARNDRPPGAGGFNRPGSQPGSQPGAQPANQQVYRPPANNAQQPASRPPAYTPPNQQAQPQNTQRPAAQPQQPARTPPPARTQTPPPAKTTQKKDEKKQQ